VVWALDSLGDDELAAITAVRNLYNGQNDAWRATLRVRRHRRPRRHDPEAASPSGGDDLALDHPVHPGTVPQRRQSWTDHLATEVRRELGHLGIDIDCDVSTVDDDWVMFRRYRPTARTRRGSRQGQARQASAMLRVTFTAPVHGPIAIGHLAHFGLGRRAAGPRTALSTAHRDRLGHGRDSASRNRDPRKPESRP
jgi:CRISPR-associated protein Csb2